MFLIFQPPPSPPFFGGVEEGQYLSVCVNVVVCLLVYACVSSLNLRADSPNYLIGV